MLITKRPRQEFHDFAGVFPLCNDNRKFRITFILFLQTGIDSTPEFYNFYSSWFPQFIHFVEYKIVEVSRIENSFQEISKLYVLTWGRKTIHHIDVDFGSSTFGEVQPLESSNLKITVTEPSELKMSSSCTSSVLFEDRISEPEKSISSMLFANSKPEPSPTTLLFDNPPQEGESCILFADPANPEEQFWTSLEKEFPLSKENIHDTSLDEPFNQSVMEGTDGGENPSFDFNLSSFL